VISFEDIEAALGRGDLRHAAQLKIALQPS